MKGLFGGTRITEGKVFIDGAEVNIQKPPMPFAPG
jgi:L-arabinose transport system ATP-binding protein